MFHTLSLPAAIPPRFGVSSPTPQIDRTSSPLLVAPVPRRPIPLVARNRRERERERERERDREQYGHLHLSPSSSLSNRPAPYRFPAPNGMEERRSSLTSSTGSGSAGSQSGSRASTSASGTGRMMTAINANFELTKVGSPSGNVIDDPMAQEDGEAAADLLHRGISRLQLEQRASSLQLPTIGASASLVVPSLSEDPKTPTEPRTESLSIGTADDVGLLAPSLLDPDLTPTKARLREMKKVLPPPNTDLEIRHQEGEGRAPSVTSDSSRGTSSVEALVSRTSTSSLTVAPGDPYPSEEDYLSHLTAYSSSGFLPLSIPDTARNRSLTPPGCTLISSSPILRNHTKNPFGKSFFRAMGELECPNEEERRQGAEAPGFLPMYNLYEQQTQSSPHSEGATLSSTSGGNGHSGMEWAGREPI